MKRTTVFFPAKICSVGTTLSVRSFSNTLGKGWDKREASPGIDCFSEVAEEEPSRLEEFLSLPQLKFAEVRATTITKLTSSDRPSLALHIALNLFRKWTGVKLRKSRLFLDVSGYLESMSNRVLRNVYCQRLRNFPIGEPCWAGGVSESVTGRES